MNIKDKYINIIKLAYKPFKIKIRNPNNFKYSNELFDVHIDNKIFIFRYKFLMPANYIKDKFIDSNINTNLEKCNLIINLEPLHYSNLEAEYVSNNIIIEEYGRMIIDFANDQKKENFEYISNNSNLIDNITNNINLYDEDKLKIIDDNIKNYYKEFDCTIKILDSKWRTYDQHLNKYCREFREKVIKDKLLSLKPISNDNKINDIYDYPSFKLGPVAKFQGGMDITVLYRASHFSIFRNIIHDNSRLRGVNEYYTSKYDNTFFHNYVLFTEILKKYDNRFIFKCNKRVLYESKTTIYNYFEDLVYSRFLLYN
jgi:hypothetical protein